MKIKVTMILPGLKVYIRMCSDLMQASQAAIDMGAIWYRTTTTSCLRTRKTVKQLENS